MKCRYCGCTDGHGCLNGCFWIMPNVCSNCVVNVPNLSREMLAWMGDPDTQKIEVIITQKNKSICKLRVIHVGKTISRAEHRKRIVKNENT